MMIGEVTIAGFLALKKTPVASMLMIPLLVITILFIIYINQMHYKMSFYLPTGECMDIDDKHSSRGNLDLAFMKGKYVQPELREKKVFPKNATQEHLKKYGIYDNTEDTAAAVMENGNGEKGHG
jgi:hypothetical protein